MNEYVCSLFLLSFGPIGKPGPEIRLVPSVAFNDPRSGHSIIILNTGKIIWDATEKSEIFFVACGPRCSVSSISHEFSEF